MIGGQSVCHDKYGGGGCGCGCACGCVVVWLCGCVVVWLCGCVCACTCVRARICADGGGGGNCARCMACGKALVCVLFVRVYVWARGRLDNCPEFFNRLQDYTTTDKDANGNPLGDACNTAGACLFRRHLCRRSCSPCLCCVWMGEGRGRGGCAGGASFFGCPRKHWGCVHVAADFYKKQGRLPCLLWGGSVQAVIPLACTAASRILRMRVA